MPKPYWEVFAKFAAPRRRLRGPPRDRQVLGAGRGRGGARRHRRAPASSPRSRRSANTRKPPTPYNTTAFTTDASSRLGITPSRRDADRRGPLHGRVHLLPAHRQHRLPGVAEHARAGHARWSGSRSFSAAAGLLDGELTPTRGKKETTDHPPIYPTQAVYPNALDGPKRRVYELVVRRFLATFCAADDHRVDPRRHRGRLGDLLRPRLGGRRPRLRRDLHLRPLRRRGDPEARAGPGARPRRRPVDGRQGDPAAVADQPGQAGRDDGGARPRHQGDPRRHHPEALRPRLRVLEPARALGDRDRHVQGLPRVRAADGDARR